MQPDERSTVAAPDDGWLRLEDANPFNALLGPFFELTAGERLEAGELGRWAFRVRRDHCNQAMTCHGGMLSTFLDISLARGLSAAEGFFASTPTISLTLDFLSSAPIGAWVESRVTVLKRTRQLGFLQALLVHEGEVLLRGSGTYKRPRSPAEGEGKA